MTTEIERIKYPNKIKDFYYGKLNWCGCGNPVETLEFMRDVLNALKTRSDNNRKDLNIKLAKDGVRAFADISGPWAHDTAKIKELVNDETPLGLSYLYMLDGVGLLEHGGYIGGSWLTKYGEEILEELQTADIEKDMSEM
jgi:hypothetical protein